MLLLLAFLLVTPFTAYPLAAQSSPGLLVAAAQAGDPNASLIGTYTSDDGSLRVARSGARLVFTPAGQSALDVFMPTVAAHATNARAEALLRDVFDGSHDLLATALPDHRREAGVHDFGRLLATLTARLGDASAVDALGTTMDAQGNTVTFVRVRFAEDEELLKLKWRGDRLALITRGVLPQLTAYPVRGASSRFAVLNAGGDVQALATFDGGRVTVRSTVTTFTATR